MSKNQKREAFAPFEVIKKGTQDWWLWVAMLHVAGQERKRLKLSLMDLVLAIPGSH